MLFQSVDARALASQALQSEDPRRLDALLAYTADSPFLMVLAGDLIRRGKLTSPLEMSANDFRQAVFRRFEEENLPGVPEPDHRRWKLLVRAIASLAPVVESPDLLRKLARCIGDESQAFPLENDLSRLRASGLLAKEIGRAHF